MGMAFLCTSSFSLRLLAFSFVAIEGSLSRYRWLSLLGFLTHLGALAAANRQRLTPGRFSAAPMHIIGLQAAWDRFILITATFIWVSATKLTQPVVNRVMPAEMRVYACDWPIFNLGRDVACGVAAYFAPHNANGRVTRKPQHFVCNVGQIDGANASRSMPDVQRTMNTLRDVWREFSEPTMKGLVANVICMFPRVEGQRVMKQINISAWESERDAYEWYAKSPGHQQVIQNHSGGALQTFGNLLASAHPSVPSRYQDRCRHCARVVEARTVGSRAPGQCDCCGGPTFKYPTF